MASMLRNCPGCGVMIAKGHPCPECYWSEAPPEAEPDENADPNAPRQQAPTIVDLFEEYSFREKQHVRNYAVFMALMLGTGLIGLFTAIMWVRVIYLGDVGAFLRIGLLTLVSAGLGVLLKFSKTLFPTDLLCPDCDVRVDQLGLIKGHCSGCNAYLKRTAAITS